jgi:hypothetical protein
MYLATGAWYEGSWENDEMHGTYGKYCFANVFSLEQAPLTSFRETCTRGPSVKILSMAKGNYCTLMAITTKGNGRMG